MVNVGKWYTFTEYYNEEGVQITKRVAIRDYDIIGTSKIIKINGNTGTKTFWKQCQKKRQLRLF